MTENAATHGSFVLWWIMPALVLLGACGSNCPPTPAVVFDIDGTLTVDANNFLDARPDAAQAVRAYVEKGYGAIYLTSRPAVFREVTLAWLRLEGFPELPLFMPDELLGLEPQLVDYKRRVLEQRMAASDQTFLYAYGDSTSDFEAYHEAGIPAAQTFALLRRRDITCQPGVYAQCLSGYTEHLSFIASQPAADHSCR